MNDTAQTPQDRQQQQQVAQLVLEEVISQRNTLMNELASLNVQLKVSKKRCEFLEKDRDELLKKNGSSSSGSGEGD